MNAIVAKGYGGPEVFQYKQVKVPTIAEDQILVEVHASAATKADTMLRKGKPYLGRLITGLMKPKHPIPGTCFAGKVTMVGSKVSRFKAGDKVFGEAGISFSAAAEFLAIPEDSAVVIMPETLSYEEACTICDGPITSLNFLKNLAKLSSGDKALINGASGSLGVAAVQLAKHMGADVTAVCSGSNAGMVKALGADKVIDYRHQDFTALEEKYDVIYDTIGKRSFKECKPALAKGGQYLSPVLQFPLLISMLLTSFIGNKKAKFSATGMLKPTELRSLLAELIEIHSLGHLTIPIDRQYPLARLADAHGYIDQGHKKGNVVIIVKP